MWGAFDTVSSSLANRAADQTRSVFVFPRRVIFMSVKITALPPLDNPHIEKEAAFSAALLEMAGLEADSVLKSLGTQLSGLNEAEAGDRLKQHGLNEIAREKHKSALIHLLNNMKNPLVILLAVLAVISYLTGDLRATVVILAMILLGIVLRFYQELRADNAAAELKAMVSNRATVIRNGEEKEIPLKMLAPGDIVRLSAGDMIPADVRVLSAKDLFLNQSALTGEALPVEKNPDPAPKDIKNPLDLANLCFLGSNVVSGTAAAVVIHTGDKTYFGSLAASIVEQRELTSFDKGINGFTWMMIRFSQPFQRRAGDVT
jgi:Mg2+-importing ATPase